MKNFLTNKALLLLSLTGLLFFISCNESQEDIELIGQDGDPRFNLVFDNEENVDLDLYVQTPSGSVIYYSNPEADNGQLDVDCLCEECPQGPNENIYWEIGEAPNGTYKYWVNYFDSCSGSNASSSFTVRVVQNEVVIATKRGTLNSGQSEIWTHYQD